MAAKAKSKPASAKKKAAVSKKSSKLKVTKGLTGKKPAAKGGKVMKTALKNPKTGKAKSIVKSTLAKKLKPLPKKIAGKVKVQKPEKIKIPKAVAPPAPLSAIEHVTGVSHQYLIIGRKGDDGDSPIKVAVKGGGGYYRVHIHPAGVDHGLVPVIGDGGPRERYTSFKVNGNAQFESMIDKMAELGYRVMPKDMIAQNL